MSKSKKSIGESLRVQLERVARLRAELSTDPVLAEKLRDLNAWQARRLAATYADLAAEPRYAKAVEFFLTDLYGPQDFSARDQDVERVYPLMARVLSARALESIALGVELHGLSYELDVRLARELLASGPPGEVISAAAYADAFRRCDNYGDREHQIALLEKIGRALDDVVARPMIYRSVRLARKPASAAGFSALQQFIERGLAAFREMRGAQEFIATIASREAALLDALYARAPAAPPPGELQWAKT